MNHDRAGSTTKQVIISTDGACIDNPGPGGFGIVLLYGRRRKELSGGFRRTTNNRMELMGAIEGLRALKTRCIVTPYTDSQYLANSISLGWAARWRANGWKRNKKDIASNPDLWEKLLDLCAQHEVTVEWVKGHAGEPENERCDWLSMQAAQQPDLPPDSGYEQPVIMTAPHGCLLDCVRFTHDRRNISDKEERSHYSIG